MCIYFIAVFKDFGYPQSWRMVRDLCARLVYSATLPIIEVFLCVAINLPSVKCHRSLSVVPTAACDCLPPFRLPAWAIVRYFPKRVHYSYDKAHFEVIKHHLP